jgi:hypothetical protein
MRRELMVRTASLLYTARELRTRKIRGERTGRIRRIGRSRSRLPHPLPHICHPLPRHRHRHQRRERRSQRATNRLPDDQTVPAGRDQTHQQTMDQVKHQPLVVGTLLHLEPLKSQDPQHPHPRLATTLIFLLPYLLIPLPCLVQVARDSLDTLRVQEQYSTRLQNYDEDSATSTPVQADRDHPHRPNNSAKRSRCPYHHQSQLKMPTRLPCGSSL